MNLDEMREKTDQYLYVTMSPREVFREFEDSRDRVLEVERRLNELYRENADTIRLMIASAIAQQTFIMIGPPGVAKTAMATKFFELLGLSKPTEASKEGGEKSAYFEYLLHSFTIPEELYGPINIEELRGKEIMGDKGQIIKRTTPRVVRENKNMLTGPGVKACFLDEVFKANSAILNTLLTLINERRYFNDSIFQPSDLRVIFGASNETPTVKGSGRSESGGGSGIVSELRAFYDRWTIRSFVDKPSCHDRVSAIHSPYAAIRDAALEQHWSRFHKGRPEPEEPKACINDIVLLGRCIIKQPGYEDIYRNTVADPDDGFVTKMLDLAIALARDEEHQMCSINPRKILFVEMVIRAHALLSEGPKKRPMKKHLAIYRHIWDSENKREDLAKTVNNIIEYEGNLE
jgi:MoxR-like ATPase